MFGAPGVVTSRVRVVVAILVTLFSILITLLITNREPPSGVPSETSTPKP